MSLPDLPSKTVSVVIPCYNPAPGWCRSLMANMTELNKRLSGYDVQYIISNDGSTRIDKRSVASVSRFKNLIFLDHEKNEGKGAAIRKGVAAASGDLIVYTDTDFPFGIKSVVDVVRLLEEEPACDFVYGKRASPYFAKLPFKRQVVSKLLQWANRLLFAGESIDTQAGIKGMRKSIKPFVMMTKTNTFVFEVELIRMLIKQKIGIRPVEVTPIPTIVFSNFSSRVLIFEALSLARIVFMSSLWNEI